jgi:hypothetical protein
MTAHWSPVAAISSNMSRSLRTEAGIAENSYRETVRRSKR